MHVEQDGFTILIKILFCSSENSSGIKISSGKVSLIKNSPPLMACLSTFVSMGLLLNVVSVSLKLMKFIMHA